MHNLATKMFFERVQMLCETMQIYLGERTHFCEKTLMFHERINVLEYKIWLENANKNMSFHERMQSFLGERKYFIRKCNCFVREHKCFTKHKVSWGNAKNCLENKCFVRELKCFAKDGECFMTECKVSLGTLHEKMEMFLKRTQSFSAERNSCARERKCLVSKCKVNPSHMFFSMSIQIILKKLHHVGTFKRPGFIQVKNIQLIYWKLYKIHFIRPNRFDYFVLHQQN